MFFNGLDSVVLLRNSNSNTIFYCRYALAISRARASRGVQRLHHRKTTTRTVSKRSTASTHSPLRPAKTVLSGATHLHRRRTTTHKTSKEAQRLASRASTPPTPCSAGRRTYTVEETTTRAVPKRSIASTHSWHRPTQASPAGQYTPPIEKRPRSKRGRITKRKAIRPISRDPDRAGRRWSGAAA